MLIPDLAVIGNHDHLIASVLIFGGLGWAVLATLVVAFFKGANRPAPRRLPGALGDSVRGEDAYYERLREPGMGDLRSDLADRRPCGGTNANICVAEGCYGEACLRLQPAVVETLDAARLRRSGS